MNVPMLDGLLALARLTRAIAVEPPAQRMALRVLMAARRWQIEKCHQVNRYTEAWNGTPIERELFEAVSDLWAEAYTLDRMNHGNVMDEDGRRKRRSCQPRMTERLHHA